MAHYVNWASPPASSVTRAFGVTKPLVSAFAHLDLAAQVPLADMCGERAPHTRPGVPGVSCSDESTANWRGATGGELRR